MQNQKDDILAAISEGVLEPEAEYCPLLVFQPAGDKMNILVDGEICRVVDASSVKDIPMPQATKRLGIPSAAIEVRPSDPEIRVGVLLPPHISLLPRKAVWKLKGKKNRCYFVLNYWPMKRVMNVVECNWSPTDPLTTQTKLIEIRAWLKAAKKGHLQVFDFEGSDACPSLKLELQIYGAHIK